MDCKTCGTDRAAIIRIKFTKEGKVEYCDLCSSLTAREGAVPDIYLGSKGGLQTDENVCDPKQRRAVPYSSKREKAALLKRLGLKQAISSERHHGGRRTYEGPGRKQYFS